MDKQSKNRTASCSSSSTSTWVRGKCIGRGSFGAVSLAVNKPDGTIFAVKSIDIATCHPRQIESLENEIHILRSIPPSPHIVRFLGDDVSTEGTSSYRNLHVEYLALGTVADVAQIEEREIRQFVWCLVSALSHLHSFGVVHGDVKARNILVGSGYSSVKLADFGSSIESCDGFTDPVVPRGSPLWMAPEVIRGEYQGPESDVWSLGCTVIEMVTGKPAWDSGYNSLSRIGYSDELPKYPTSLSELGRDFLDKCLRREPGQRWSSDKLLEHPFLLPCHSVTESYSSPRCVLDLVNSDFEEKYETGSDLEFEISARNRIRQLATSSGVLWESDGWESLRNQSSHEGRANLEICSFKSSSLEGQCCNFNKTTVVEVGSTSELSCCVGLNRRYEPLLTVERREDNAFSFNLIMFLLYLRIFKSYCCYNYFLLCLFIAYYFVSHHIFYLNDGHPNNIFSNSCWIYNV